GGISPLTIDHAPSCLRAQNGPPGWAIRISTSSPITRYGISPALGIVTPRRPASMHAWRRPPPPGRLPAAAAIGLPDQPVLRCSAPRGDGRRSSAGGPRRRRCVGHAAAHPPPRRSTGDGPSLALAAQGGVPWAEPPRASPPPDPAPRPR